VVLVFCSAESEIWSSPQPTNQLCHSEGQVWVRIWGNSEDKLCHSKTDAYSTEQVLQNEQQILDGGACLHSYRIWVKVRVSMVWVTKDGTWRIEAVLESTTTTVRVVMVREGIGLVLV